MKTQPKEAAEDARAKEEAEQASELAKLLDEMIPSVKTRLGDKRLAALAKQPLCLAAGGIDKVLQLACTEVAGFPQPVVSAAARTLQLCGSFPTKEDLKA